MVFRRFYEILEAEEGSKVALTFFFKVMEL